MTIRSAFFVLIACVACASAAETSDWEKPWFCHSIDCPKYEVLQKFDDFELRRYEAGQWASTRVVGFEYGAALRRGFDRLFSYISGANEKKQEIPMTAPVRTRVIPSDGPFCKSDFIVSFFVPYDQQNEAPAPTNEDVYLETTPEMDVYVTSYGGYTSQSDVISNAAGLVGKLETQGLGFEFDYYYSSGYDSPFRLFGRHNEVWIVAKDTSSS